MWCGVIFLFFFQAEDGIRDRLVTGVQTCALPISSNDNIEVAKLHSKEMNLNIKYIHCSPENLNFKNEFDVILNMEVVEHVSNVSLFMQNCSKLIKKNGIMFVATINKNLKSYIFAILGAEDRKSTRLNSSHKPISYAVFCLKKKKQKKK